MKAEHCGTQEERLALAMEEMSPISTSKVYIHLLFTNTDFAAAETHLIMFCLTKFGKREGFALTCRCKANKLRRYPHLQWFLMILTLSIEPYLASGTRQAGSLIGINCK